MAEETTTTAGPPDAEFNRASGEHSANQNVLAAGASDPQTGLPAAPSLPISQAGASEVEELQKEAPALPAAQIPQPPQKAVDPEIARMISEIKLPERRMDTVAEKAAATPRTFDTALGSSLSAQNERPEGMPLIKSFASGAARGTHGDFSLTGQAGSSLSEEDAPQKEIQKDKSSPLSSLHTLKDDLQTIVREKKISLVRAAAFGQEKRSKQAHAEHDARPGRGRKALLAATGIFLFIALGLASLFFVYSRMQEGESAAMPVGTSLIFSEKTAVFPMDNLSDIDIKRSLSQARNVSGTLGSIIHIVPVVSEAGEILSAQAGGDVREKPVTIGEFLKAVNARAAPELVRSLRGDFFLGVHTLDKNAPFLIVPVVSYERAFSGMLAWEATLNEDLAPVFSAVPRQTADLNGLFVERRFQDIVISNYDVRALPDDSGSIQMFYSFPTRNLLIIAENPNSFMEILSRLRANRQL